MNQPVPDVGPAAPEEVPDETSDEAFDETPDAEPDGRPRFRLAYVPGATPGKWASVWHERLPDVRLELVQVEAGAVAAALETGDVDAAIGRLPVDKDVFSAIPLYEESSVVLFSRDHLLAALADDEIVSAGDIAQDPVWVPGDDVLFTGGGTVPGTAPADPDGNPLERVPTTADVVATVAANVGVAVLPMSLARLHRRKDVTYRPLSDGPTAPVGLVWPIERTTDLVEELIGIVRGRTVNSSRGRGAPSSRPGSDGTSADAPTAKSARTGVKNSPRSGSAGTKGRSGAGRSGAKTGGRGAVPRGKGARPASGKKKKGKGR